MVRAEVYPRRQIWQMVHAFSTLRLLLFCIAYVIVETNLSRRADV